MEYLEFEKPLEELMLQMQKTHDLSKEGDLDVKNTIKEIEKKIEKCQKEIYSNLTPWQRVHDCSNMFINSSTSY